MVQLVQPLNLSIYFSIQYITSQYYQVQTVLFAAQYSKLANSPPPEEYQLMSLLGTLGVWGSAGHFCLPPSWPVALIAVPPSRSASIEVSLLAPRAAYPEPLILGATWRMKRDFWYF